MDSNNRARDRHNEQSYSASDPRFNQPQNRDGFSSSLGQGHADRYSNRPPPILTTPPSSGRGGSGTGSTAAYPYYQAQQPNFPATQGSMYGSQQGYGQDQRQPTNYGSFNAPDAMYQVPQAAPADVAFDTSSQFQQQSRQSAGSMLQPSDANPYFNPSSGLGPPGLQHHASTNSSNAYQPSPADRGSHLQQSYAANIQMGGMPRGAEDSLAEEYVAPPELPGMEVAYSSYQEALKEVFQNIINNQLSVAAVSLLQISEWLLGHVSDLGLTVDEPTLHADRIRLWGEFNTAWQAIFQKQLDVLESGQWAPNTLITTDNINKMAKDLIRMADGIEKYGLVDYQYGVAEELIIEILEKCLSKQEEYEAQRGPV